MSIDWTLYDEWADALESGKYPQCRGKLHDPDGYCCLGVLVELAYGPDIWECNYEFWDNAYTYKNPNGDMESENIDGELERKVMGDIIDLDGEILAIQNDRGDSFQKIAAYLRQKKAEYLAEHPSE